MFVECQNCGFYVNPNDKFCPDCGLTDPNDELLPVNVQVENRMTLKIIGIIGAAVLVGFVLYRLNGGSPEFGDWFRLAFVVLFIGTAISILAVLLNARTMASALRGERFAGAENGATLAYVYENCLLRIDELGGNQRESRRSVRRGVRISDGENKSDRRQSKNEFSVFLDRYDLFLKRIWLVRFQNQLMPLADKQNGLSDAEFFDEFDELSMEIAGVRFEVEDIVDRRTAENFMIEKRDFLTALRKTEDLRAVLVERRSEAMRFNTAFAPLNDEELTSQLEILNPRPNIAEISRSFAQLEREYERAKTK